VLLKRRKSDLQALERALVGLLPRGTRHYG
jgi:hypothetical protein